MASCAGGDQEGGTANPQPGSQRSPDHDGPATRRKQWFRYLVSRCDSKSLPPENIGSGAGFALRPWPGVRLKNYSSQVNRQSLPDALMISVS
jgi:hypothetical protein